MAKKELEKKEFDMKALRQEFDNFKKEVNEWQVGIAENVNSKMDTISQDITDKHAEFETSLSEKMNNEKYQNSETNDTDEGINLTTELFNTSI